METVKVLNVTATPIHGSGYVPPSLQQSLNDAVSMMNETMGSFEESEKETQAKSILHDFHGYVKSGDFKKDIEEASKKYHVSPKKLAKNFFEKVLGTVGDVLGIAINVVCKAGHMVINIIGTVAHSIVNLINTIANGLASIVTLNKTCVA